MAGLMPSGMGREMPPAGGGQLMPEMDGGASMASPEEQALYDRFVSRGMQMVYGSEQGLQALVETMRSAPDPKQGLATAAATVVNQVIEMAEQAGQKLPGDVILHGGTELFEDLAELATRAGVYDFEGDPDAMEGAFFLALDDVRMMQDQAGRIDQESMGQDLAEMMAADQEGRFARDLMALPGASDDQGDDEMPSEDNEDDMEDDADERRAPPAREDRPERRPQARGQNESPRANISEERGGSKQSDGRRDSPRRGRGDADAPVSSGGARADVAGFPARGSTISGGASKNVAGFSATKGGLLAGNASIKQPGFPATERGRNP